MLVGSVLHNSSCIYELNKQVIFLSLYYNQGDNINVVKRLAGTSQNLLFVSSACLNSEWVCELKPG